jgi:hypothetical protein
MSVVIAKDQQNKTANALIYKTPSRTDKKNQHFKDKE